ncbi:MAG TPA: DUF4931 domain-containing protein [Microthrixaceae bacterium]|nr:DUF4931 domain-containing protein [Microthrixaceae bacterium]
MTVQSTRSSATDNAEAAGNLETAQSGSRIANDPRRVTVKDTLTGAQVVINASRQARPNLPVTSCPFCPGGLEAPEPYDVFWFKNRWPAMPAETCEVVLYAQQHDASFWSLGTDGARKVIDLWAERTEALGSRDDIEYVLIFENRGAEVGATIAHPHGQIYAFGEIPPAPLKELVDGYLSPSEIDPALIVSESGDWRAWVPEAAVYPYELRIAPTGNVGSLTDDSCDRDRLAATLVDSLARLDQLFDEEMPYMLWIHQRPSDGHDWPDHRLHFHITPLRRGPGVTRFVAAAELGAQVYFNPVQPSVAADQLRRLPGLR